MCKMDYFDMKLSVLVMYKCNLICLIYRIIYSRISYFFGNLFENLPQPDNSRIVILVFIPL
jgi:hypothetical protein